MPVNRPAPHGVAPQPNGSFPAFAVGYTNHASCRSGRSSKPESGCLRRGAPLYGFFICRKNLDPQSDFPPSAFVSNIFFSCPNQSTRMHRRIIRSGFVYSVRTWDVILRERPPHSRIRCGAAPPEDKLSLFSTLPANTRFHRLATVDAGSGGNGVRSRDSVIFGSSMDAEKNRPRPRTHRGRAPA